MTSSHSRFGITLAFLGLASILPATVGAQPPVYLTQWGTHGGGDGQFSDPFGVATDAAGNVYVADTGNNRIQKFTSTGTYLTQWGSPGTSDGQFNSPFAVATDAAGDVYVSDTGNNRIQKFTSTGTYVTQWGLPPDSSGALFNGPLALATDAAGNVYISDQNFRVQKFTGTGTYLTQWGSFGSGDGEFSYFPFGVTTDAAGNVYVSDFGSNRIQKFTDTGTYLAQWGSTGSGDGQFLSPYGLATDVAGNVYVVDFDNNRTQEFTGTGTYLTQWGSLGSGDGQFTSPRAVATDAAGNVYVVDQGNHRIQKFGAESTPPPAVSFDLTPNMLNLASPARWVTGFLEPASPFTASDIDIASIRLNGTVPVDPAAPTALGDHNGNGVPDLMVKFNRAAVELTVSEGVNIPITVTGSVDGHPFVGTDYISVRRAVVSAPRAGSTLMAGSLTQIRWQRPSGVRVRSVTVLLSLDGGNTWTLIAHGQPNSGSYDWTLPNVQTDQAKVAVLAKSADQTGDIVEGVLGVSDGFSIKAIVGTGDGGPPQFALRGVTPNPTRHELQVSFALRDSKPASLALYDVSGRQLAARRVEGMGPGWHTVTLGGRSSLPAGLYIIRLTQDGRSLTTRAAVVR